MTNCAIQPAVTPLNPSHLAVFANCVLVPGPSSLNDDAGTSWNIDYSTEPARLVFGAEVCNQLRMNSNTPVYMFIWGIVVC